MSLPAAGVLGRMRLAAFVRTGRALAPLLAGLIGLAVLYGGGRAQAAEAYGVSAVVMFPVLAWQTKLLLDAEPDVQRRIALAAAGRWADLAGGLLAAGAAALLSVLLALVLPWLIGGITGPTRAADAPLAAQLALGVWAHLLAVPAAIALGALASRAVTRGAAYGVIVLAVGVVGTLVLGLRGSVAPWAVPPIMATARAMADQPGVQPTTLLGMSAHALAWTAAMVAGYAWLRRTRT